MRKLSAKWVPKCLKADKKRRQCQSSEQILELFQRDANDFLSLLEIMDETWLYQYDPKTKQQSMDWRHSGSPRPKCSECINPLENFSPRFSEIKKASSSLIIFQRAELTTRSITHLCWCNWRTLWRKNTTRNSPNWYCSCTTMPRLTEHPWIDECLPLISWGCSWIWCGLWEWGSSSYNDKDRRSRLTCLTSGAALQSFKCLHGWSFIKSNRHSFFL